MDHLSFLWSRMSSTYLRAFKDVRRKIYYYGEPVNITSTSGKGAAQSSPWYVDIRPIISMKVMVHMQIADVMPGVQEEIRNAFEEDFPTCEGISKSSLLFSP